MKLIKETKYTNLYYLKELRREIKVRSICFIIVGLAGLIAAIAIMLYTVQFFLLFLIGDAIGKAVVMGIL